MTLAISELDPEKKAALRAAIEHRCWVEGDIETVAGLHPGQMELLERFFASDKKLHVWLIARRWGKSYACDTLCIKTAVTKPGSIIRIACPTERQAQEIAMPHFARILSSCPPPMRPKERNGRYEFPNGSVILLFGADDRRKIDRGRGTSMDLGVVDEAGSIPQLQYLVQDVMLPMLATTKGSIVLASTPPLSPAHELTSKYVPEAEADGTLVRRDIYSAPHIDPDELEKLREVTLRSEGKSTWLREYEAVVVTDENLAVLPEFSEHEEYIVVERERPEACFTYVSLDLGYKDLSFGVLAHHDFERDVIFVEDEVVLRRATSGDVARECRTKEQMLWPTGTTRKGETPFLRVADAPLQVVADLQYEHGYLVAPARKDDADASLNALRVALATGRIEIHPRCEQLIRHCREAIWTSSRKTYERSADFGHFDGVDALRYLQRSVDRKLNPYTFLPHSFDHANQVVSPTARRDEGAGPLQLAKLLKGNAQHRRRGRWT